MNTCISITARTMPDALKDIAIVSRHADFIELRLDQMHNPDVARLIRASTKPVIVTNRPRSEGGSFNGTEHERIALLLHALQVRPAFIDIELSTDAKLLREILSRRGQTKVILSHHDFKKTPPAATLRRLVKQMLRLKPDVIKIVTTARSLDDNTRMMELVHSNQENLIIGFCMGEIGQPTRITTLMHGGWLTFFSLNDLRASASGQIAINRVINGVIGKPVHHTLSPIIHRAGFHAIGSTALYLPLEILDDARVVPVMKKLNMRMISVTTPFKRSIVKHLDRVDTAARTIGAVNTIIQFRKKCTGFNTDGIGMRAALGSVRGKHVAIIGAGGAARAIAFELRRNGAQVTVFNRTRSRAQSLARDLKVEAAPLTSFPSFADTTDILINATTVGMKPLISRSSVHPKLLRNHMTVADAVYHPLRTKLIRDAARIGCPVITGDQMLLHQACKQFALMTGKAAPKKTLAHALHKALTHSHGR